MDVVVCIVDTKGFAVTFVNASFAFFRQSSVLGAGFGDLGQSKRSQPSAGAQILEQLKGPGLGPLPSSQATAPVSARLPGLGVSVPPPVSSSWELKVSEPGASSLSSQFSRECSRAPGHASLLLLSPGFVWKC